MVILVNKIFSLQVDFLKVKGFSTEMFTICSLDICHQVLDLYSQPQQPNSPDSPPMSLTSSTKRELKSVPIVAQPIARLSPVKPIQPIGKFLVMVHFWIKVDFSTFCKVYKIERKNTNITLLIPNNGFHCFGIL